MGYWVVVLVCLVCARKLCVLAWVRVLFLVCGGVGVSGVCGERGCLGVGCVVAGGVLPVWLGDAVAGGGVSVGFDVGLRVFVLSGVGVPASGGVAASVGSPVSGPVGVADGVAVCVPCAVRVFGDGWCGLVLRRWCAAAGVDVGVVDGLLGSAPVSGGVGGGSVASLRSSALVVASSPGFASASGSSSVPAPVVSRAGRVGVGFGARVRDWGALVGVGGGVVSGGGVVAHLWARARGRVSGLVSGVGVKGLVLLGLVGVVLLVSVLVLVG